MVLIVRVIHEAQVSGFVLKLISYEYLIVTFVIKIITCFLRKESLKKILRKESLKKKETVELF